MAIDMMHRRSESGPLQIANEAAENNAGGGEEGQRVHALLDGREAARVEPETQTGERPPQKVGNPFWSDRDRT